MDLGKIHSRVAIKSNKRYLKYIFIYLFTDLVFTYFIYMYIIYIYTYICI